MRGWIRLNGRKDLAEKLVKFTRTLRAACEKRGIHRVRPIDLGIGLA